MGGYPYASADNTIYQFLTIPGVDIYYRGFYTVIGASILLYLVLTTEGIANFLKRPYISMLGKYTFSLYLTHAIVLYTFTSFMFVLFVGHMDYHYAVMGAFIASVPVIAAFTWLFERYVDAPSVKFASYLARLYYHPESLRVKERAAQLAVNIRTRLLPGKMPDMEED